MREEIPIINLKDHHTLVWDLKIKEKIPTLVLIIIDLKNMRGGSSYQIKCEEDI